MFAGGEGDRNISSHLFPPFLPTLRVASSARYIFTGCPAVYECHWTSGPGEADPGVSWTDLSAVPVLYPCRTSPFRIVPCLSVPCRAVPFRRSPPAAGVQAAGGASGGERFLGSIPREVFWREVSNLTHRRPSGVCRNKLSFCWWEERERWSESSLPRGEWMVYRLCVSGCLRMD